MSRFTSSLDASALPTLGSPPGGRRLETQPIHLSLDGERLMGDR
jgi:hypothetical protein